VSLLLCALHDCLDANSAARLQEVYLTNKFRDPDDTPKFVPTQADRVVYQAIATNRVVPEQDGLIVQAYHYFKDRLLSGSDPNGDPVSPAKVLTTLEHALQVVMINLGEGERPSSVCTANTRSSPWRTRA